MKRKIARKLRDRRTGMSPYQRHKKAEYKYTVDCRHGQRHEETHQGWTYKCCNACGRIMDKWPQGERPRQLAA
jgi:hypothetical protein